MSGKSLKPRIRFKGFTDDWEQRKLSDVATYRNGKAHENSIYDDGKYIVVNSKFVSTDGEVIKKSNEQIEPLYKNEIAFVLSDVPNGRAIARTFLVEKDGKYTLNQRIAGITPNDKTCPYYLHILMNRHKYFLSFDDGAKQTNLSVKDVLGFEANYPSFYEQEKIGYAFSIIDELITLHQRKYDKLTQIKKSLLEKMFPAEGDKTPKIRFKGFTDDWEQRKLREVIRKPVTDGPHETPVFVADGIPFLSVEAIHDGEIDISKARGMISKTDDERFKLKYVPEKGDVYFTKAATIGRVAIVNEPNFNIWSPIGAIKPDFSKVTSEFIFHCLQTNKIMNEAIIGSNNGSQYNLGMDKIEDFSIDKPIIDEQVQISSFLSGLDNLITLHQRKCEKLKNIKKSLLEKMFV